MDMTLKHDGNTPEALHDLVLLVPIAAFQALAAAVVIKIIAALCGA